MNFWRKMIGGGSELNVVEGHVTCAWPGSPVPLPSASSHDVERSNTSHDRGLKGRKARFNTSFGTKWSFQGRRSIVCQP